MHGQEKAHGGGFAQHQEQQSGQAGQEQDGDEGHVHAETRLVDHRRIAPQLRREKPCGADQHADAADGAEHDREVVPGIRRMRPST